jgi:hypothetical protein
MRYTCGSRVTLSQLVEQFLDLERRLAPEAWHAAEVPIWPYLRQRLFDDFSNAHGLHAERQSAPVRHYTREAVAQRSQLARIAQRYDLRRLGRAPILLLSHSRHYPLGDQRVSPYTHFLLRELPRESYWDLQFSDAGHHHVDDGLERVVYLDALYQAAFKGYALLRRWGSFRRAVRAAAGDVGATLEKELGLSPGLARLDRLVWNAVRVHHGWGEMCERLLDRVRPELVINVVHYNWTALALTARAHRRGIPVVELQHGTVSPEHIAYNVGCRQVSPTTPDYFLSFGEFWSEMVRGLGLPEERVPAIGFSWLENRIAAAPRAPSKTLLVLSQRSIGVALSRLAVDVAKRLAPQGWRVIYRLHPGEIADHGERLPWLQGAPLEVSTGKLDLYRQFGEVGAQLGVYSTALFEGVAFSLPTLIARLPGSESLEPFVRFGGARFVSDAEDVAQALGELGGGVPDELVRRVWQPSAAENFRRFVESRLGKTGS